MQTHHFNAGSFTVQLWIAGKRVFPKLKGVDVEFVNAGAWDWVIADTQGKVVKTLRHANSHGGWTSIDLPSLGLYGDFRIGFRNVGASEKKLKQGDVHYGV